MQCGRKLHVVLLKSLRKNMNFIKGLDVKAHEWLSNVPPSTWFRSHFSTKSKCAILVNNPVEADINTLSTDSWRRIKSLESEPKIGSIVFFYDSPCLFFNRALPSIAYFQEHGLIILSFDVDDERFRNIMLPQDYLNGHNEVVTSSIERLAVIKGSLALIVFSNYFDAITTKCHIWVMREYGVVESWTKTSVPVHSVKNFYGYTVNGKLLIENANRLVSFDPKSLNENVLAIEAADWMGHTDTANSMDSLVLLDCASVI